jgi:hypothetical protein
MGYYVPLHHGPKRRAAALGHDWIVRASGEVCLRPRAVKNRWPAPWEFVHLEQALERLELLENTLHLDKPESAGATTEALLKSRITQAVKR